MEETLALLQNWKRGKTFLSFFIVLCIVPQINTQGGQQSKEMCRTLFNQTLDLLGEQEANSQEVHFYTAVFPTSKETELGHSQPSIRDTTTNYQDREKPRRVEKSAEPTNSEDRIRWLLLLSPLVIFLLIVIICTVGKKITWPPIQDDENIQILKEEEGHHRSPEGPVNVSSVSEENKSKRKWTTSKKESKLEKIQILKEEEGHHRSPEGPVNVSSVSGENKSKRKQTTSNKESELETNGEICQGEWKHFLTEMMNQFDNEDHLDTDGRSSGITLSATTVSGTRSDELKTKFLEKLMALDISARNTVGDSEEIDLDFLEECEDMDMESSSSFHPLDVICELLHHSDMILQQLILSKMSMCQFALPLLLPSPNRQDCSFMLWSMRDIVKIWRPLSLVKTKGYEEDSIVNVPMPIFSFVRLGTCSISKSQYLNLVLSQSQKNINFFVHSNMPGGNIPKKLSDGLVEIFWYLPTGHEQIDVFSDPIAVMNLRGDLGSNQEQFRFLTSVSSGMFIFLEDINENHQNLLTDLQGRTNVFLILNVRDGENTKNLKTLIDELQLPKQNILVKNKQINDFLMIKKIQSAMKIVFPKTKETLSLEQIAKTATKFNIRIDEHSPECQKTKAKAKKIIDEIYSVKDYKQETMKLQGERWKQISKMEKELCRMRELGDRDAEKYKSEIREKILQLQKQQRELSHTHVMLGFQETLMMHSIWKKKTSRVKVLSVQDNEKCKSQIQARLLKLQEQHRQGNFTFGMIRFQQAFMYSPQERRLFLKWLKILLDTKGKHHLKQLQNEYRRKVISLSATENDFRKIDQELADSSLGVEHFIRELGLFYETQSKNKDKFTELPEIAADLLLDGFPLELIDGDASNIPLQWITDVLTELDKKTGGQCRMRVITVLGVQSTGKSTLLNTMFGLQFPVASGRCTRGAFMTLINVKEENPEKLNNCDFILVIDTEGLKSLELLSLEESYEHDNELATLVVGLSDITIINMAMENAEEVKDILQIVIHAFLRMKGIGKTSRCQFVHQNVSNVSAYVKNKAARQKFLEQLCEMTKIAARMEKRSGVNHFSDIIYCDIERDSWYIPELWYGIPPMASVSMGYSEMVGKLKESILQNLQSMPGKPQNIREFTEWIKSLWNAVKHEKFIFSFRNRLVTEAYNQLCIHYADWEWTFQKNIHKWMMETETFIYNLPYEKLGADFWSKHQNDINQRLDEEERAMSQCLEEYFENDCENAHLLEMFQRDFFRSVKYLRKEHENVLHEKFKKAIGIQKEKSKIQVMQAQYIDIMEKRVAEMIEQRRNTKYMGDYEEPKNEFDAMWEKTVSTLRLSKLEKRHIDHEILQQLKRDTDCDDDVIKERLHKLYKYNDRMFVLKDKHLSDTSPENRTIIKDLTASLIDECRKYVEEVTKNNEDFNEIYSGELLSLINKRLKRTGFQDVPITKLFELDLKLHILNNACVEFQKMHEDFIQRNDPMTCLEMVKPQYYSIFKNIYEKRDECRRKAEQFCELCLKPAIADHINKYLGKEIMDDILQSSGPQEFKSRKYLQLVILEKLLADNSGNQYVEYINNYERFLKSWISAYIAKHYHERGHIRALQEKTLHSLMGKVQQALYHSTLSSSGNHNIFLKEFCKVLEKDLVISKNDMKVVLFQSNPNVKQFAKDVDLYLCHLQDEIQQEMTSRSTESILSQLTLQPQEELFKKMIGCGQRCPFCKAPCEAGGADHVEHFASLHRPRGLGQHKDEQTNVLDHSICSTNVISNKSFSNEDTDWKPHPYKDYRTYYPDWAIYPDMAANASDYWKFVFKEYKDTFTQSYRTTPAKIPKDWYKINQHQALSSLRTTLQ